MEQQAHKLAGVGGWVRHAPSNTLEGEVSGTRDKVLAMYVLPASGEVARGGCRGREEQMGAVLTHVCACREEWLRSGEHPDGIKIAKLDITDDGRFVLRQPLHSDFRIDYT